MSLFSESTERLPLSISSSASSHFPIQKDAQGWSHLKQRFFLEPKPASVTRIQSGLSNLRPPPPSISCFCRFSVPVQISDISNGMEEWGVLLKASNDHF